MTKQEFDMKYHGKKVAVHCDTEEKAKAYLALEYSFGTIWSNGERLDETLWGSYKKETCYSLFKDGKMVVGYLDWYKSEGYTIVEFELEKETTKENDMRFKVGQKVRVRTDLKDSNFYEGIFFNKQMENARGKVFTIGSISQKNHYTLSDFAYRNYLWSDEMLEPVEEETFKVGDVVYDEKGRKCVIKTIAYRVEYTTTHQGYREANEITHKKPLTKITKEQLANMGYEVKE